MRFAILNKNNRMNVKDDDERSIIFTTESRNIDKEGRNKEAEGK